MDHNLSQNNVDQVQPAGADAAGDEDDSDFGDFGGFEGAEPVPVSINQQEQVSAQWAVYSAGQGSLRPDLLCAQNAFPPCLDPSDIAGGDTRTDQETALFDANFDLDNNFRENGFPDDPSENASAGGRSVPLRLSSPRGQSLGACGQIPVSPALLPDLGIGTVGLGSIAEPHWPGSDIIPNDSLPVQAGAPAQASALSSAAEESRRQSEDGADVGELQPMDGELEKDFQGVAEAAAEENVSIKELDNLRSVNARLQEELTEAETALERQKSRLEELHGKHSKNLDEVRQAGHDALAVVVEQYKELSRTAVLEQQQTSLLQLQEWLQQQSEVFQQTLQSQAEELKKLHCEAMAQSEKTLQEALDSARVKQQQKFDSFLKEETDKHKVALELAVEAERERSKELVEAAILEEQKKAEKMLEEEREKFSLSLKSMKEDCCKQIADAVEEERRKSKELLEESLKEKTAQSQEAVKETQEAAKHDMKSYIQEQRQADSLVRQRHLSTLDLFLDSARRQIGLLLETEANISVLHDSLSDVKPDDKEPHPQSDSHKPAS